jgi:hypothetical protein
MRLNLERKKRANLERSDIEDSSSSDDSTTSEEKALTVHQEIERLVVNDKRNKIQRKDLSWNKVP